MKNVKKKTALLCFLLLIFLTGCGQTKNQASEEKTHQLEISSDQEGKWMY